MGRRLRPISPGSHLLAAGGRAVLMRLRARSLARVVGTLAGAGHLVFITAFDARVVVLARLIDRRVFYVRGAAGDRGNHEARENDAKSFVHCALLRCRAALAAPAGEQSECHSGHEAQSGGVFGYSFAMSSAHESRL